MKHSLIKHIVNINLNITFDTNLINYHITMKCVKYFYSFKFLTGTLKIKKYKCVCINKCT